MNNFLFSKEIFMTNNLPDKDKIINHFSESKIFSLVFGYEPDVNDYVTSPFRIDNHPGCRFRKKPTGELLFCDYTENLFLDCICSVRKYYNIFNYKDTLDFIIYKLSINYTISKNVKVIKTNQNRRSVKRKNIETKIEIIKKEFDDNDKRYWNSYGIKIKQLKEDKVFSVKKTILSKGFEKTIFKETLNVYAYTNFEYNRKKIYRPFANKKMKFMTNCTKNDIGGINTLNNSFNSIMFSKSYKDYRVLRNMNIPNVVWLQNEGMFPDETKIKKIIFVYPRVFIFFDNDKTGIESAKRFKKYISEINENAIIKIVVLNNDLYLEGITDISDLFKAKGIGSVVNFLNSQLLLL